MSINITVNGKFAKHCKPHPLLQDREKARKEELEERRKLRLLQVREQSKQFAQKVRNDVKEATLKENQKFEAKKAEEFNCWRHHTMQQNAKDYRAAVFQIGTAHMAAKAENKEKAEKEAKKQATYKEFRRQIAARKRNKENLQKGSGPCICNKVQKCPNEKFQCTCQPQPQFQKCEEPQKRKRDSCFSSSDSSAEDSDGLDTSSGDTLRDSSLSSCVMPSAKTTATTATTTASSCSNRATQTSMVATSKVLQKTPAVFLDVEVGSDDSIVITAPAEIKDHHAEYNQQYSSVIRVSPRKTRRTQENKQTQVTRTPSLSSEPPTENLQEGNKSAVESAKNVNQPKAQAVREKRFTLISDLVKKQQDQKGHGEKVSPTRRQFAAMDNQTSPHKTITAPMAEAAIRAPVSRPSSQAKTPQISPRKGSASSKSSQFVPGVQKRPSIAASAASANTIALGSSSSTSGRVQFYDYNSKLCKDGAPAPVNVQVNRQRDTIQPTAMAQAAMENRQEQERQRDVMNRNKQIEERGQKALEREQVRRDCNELTEKLDALTRQYPRQVPTNENTPHIFADKQLRKEGKMNTAVEKLLSRPNIITCSEVNQREGADQPGTTSSKPLNMKNLYNEINVGVAANATHLPADDVSSDSCCSILLGYVDDQSRQVRKDLERWPSHEDRDKQQRLCNLLKRLDQMRENLLQELKNGQNVRKEQTKTNATEDNYNELIDTISKCRQEREDIMIGNIVNSQANMKKDEDQTRQKRKKQNGKPSAARSQKSQKDERPLDEREKELLQKEAILEKKVREFYELQKQKQKAHSLAKGKQKDDDSEKHEEKIDTEADSENKENIDCSSLETPLEIVITVKGESKCITIPAKAKRKTPVKRKPSPRATLLKSPQPAKNLTPKKKVPASKPMPTKVLGRQNSYDSNSTSYMSLPPQIPNQLGTMLDQQQRPHSTTDDTQTSLEYDDERNSTKRGDKDPVQRINPLVAQYVQRLLGMSRHAVQRLGVSSSDIDTPSSSLINTTDNVPSQESMATDERLACVESFMQENHSFIKELEQSLRAHNNSTLENSMKKLDDIWRKRLKQQKHQGDTAESRPKTATNQTNRKPTKQTSPKQNKVTAIQENILTKQITDKERRTHFKPNRPPTITSSSSILNTKKSAKERVELLESSPELMTKKSTRQSAQLYESSPELMTNNKATGKRADHHHRPVQKSVHKSVDTRSSEDLNRSEPDSQIARYAQLTENCTHRIAELTELINRVRQEKQRLLEVTLSSVSDNGRQSTEYLELPNGKSHTTNEPETSVTSSSSDEATKNKPSSTLGTRSSYHQVPTLTALDKNRHITASRDSGIADSRPITAQENRVDIEPISHTSTESQGGMLAAQRKMKPPPTLRRFSPQFQEEDLVHELSTILEVDTPANSRINTAVGSGGQSLPEERSEPPPPAVMFPTFEEYVQQLNLDITALDVAQSTQLHQEFSQYIEGLQNSKSQNGKELQYVEFPSISTYENNAKTETTDNVDAVNESLAQMRINNIQLQHFPAVREYVQLQHAKTTTSPNNDDEAQLLDTESLENITDMPTNTNTDNDTASLDIEKELKRRNILKNDFRYTKSTQIFSSTAHQDAEFYNDIMATESGLDKLSTSENNTMALLETDLKRLVSQWPMEGKNKSKQRYQAYSSTTTTTTTSTNVARKNAKDDKSTSVDESSNELGRPLNLHEFFAREFLKHVSLSGSTNSSNSEDSLRSQFLYSLIGTLTPCTNGAATTKSGQHTLDRQKTSTPVPMQSSQTHSTPCNPSRTSSSQLFSVESRISSVHMNDRSNRLQHTSDGVNGDQSSE